MNALQQAQTGQKKIWVKFLTTTGNQKKSEVWSNTRKCLSIDTRAHGHIVVCIWKMDGVTVTSPIRLQTSILKPGLLVFNMLVVGTRNDHVWTRRSPRNNCYDHRLYIKNCDATHQFLDSFWSHNIRIFAISGQFSQKWPCLDKWVQC